MNRSEYKKHFKSLTEAFNDYRKDCNMNRTIDTFVEDCCRTESIVKDDACSGLMRLIHASFGMNTEQAEFQDALKKSIFYNKPLDLINLKEELGDMLWYTAIACNELKIDLEDVMATVIRKLKKRYPEKYTDDLANTRDLFEERKALEE